MRAGLLAAAWLAGTYVGLRADASILALLLLISAAAAGALLLRLQRLPAWPLVLISLLLLALVRVEAAGAPPPPLALVDSEPAALRGRIANDPEATARNIKFTFSVEAIDRGGGMEPADGKVVAYAEPSPDLVAARTPPFFRYGDELLLEGELQRPQRLEEFDYPSYLASHGISGIVFSTDATLQDPESGAQGGWRGWIFDLRRMLSENIDEALTVPHSAVAKALLLGQRGQLPGDLVEDFRETGTSHVLAISGLHVGTLMAISLAAAAAALGRRGMVYLVVPLLLIWIYALVSGLPPSVLRAGIMGTAYIAALVLGRPRSVLPALALSAAAMTAFDPRALMQVSFQLSFAAMAGIAVGLPHLGMFSPAIDRRSAVLPDWIRPWAAQLLKGLAAALMVSAAATLATWPLVAFNFDRIPLLGIFVTVLVLPALPLVLIGSMVAAIAGFLHPAIGQFFGWMAWGPLSYLIELVSWAPGYTVSGTWVGDTLVWAWYLVLGGLLLAAGSGFRLPSLWPRLRPDKAEPAAPDGVQATGQSRAVALGFMVPALAAAAVFLWVQLLYAGHDGKLHVYFFDVGQGDSALIVSPTGRQVLVDGGPDAESATRALAGALPRGDRSLDMVVLTHLDADHSRGLLRVLEHYDVAAVVVGLEDPQSPLYPQWRSQLEREEHTPIFLREGYRIELEPSVSLEVLNPPERPIGGQAADRNNNSVVLRLVYGDASVLLSADIEAEAEARLVRDALPLESAVLKAPHHGSRSSSTAAFLDRVDPALAVVSAGADNRYGHPHREVVERLAETVDEGLLFRTDRHGTVELITDGESLWVRTER